MTDSKYEASEPVKLFVGQLPPQFTEDELRKLFEPHGTIHELVILREKPSMKSKGSGFVTLMSMTEARAAIKALHEKPVLDSGRPMVVRLAGEDAKPAEGFKLFVGMLAKATSEERIYAIFTQFGAVKEVYLMRDNEKASKGCAFVKYDTQQEAQFAIDNLHDRFQDEGSPRKLVVRYADSKNDKMAKNTMKNNTTGFRNNNFLGPSPLTSVPPLPSIPKIPTPYMDAPPLMNYNPYTTPGASGASAAVNGLGFAGMAGMGMPPYGPAGGRAGSTAGAMPPMPLPPYGGGGGAGGVYNGYGNGAYGSQSAYGNSAYGNSAYGNNAYGNNAYPPAGYPPAYPPTAYPGPGYGGYASAASPYLTGAAATAPLPPGLDYPPYPPAASPSTAAATAATPSASASAYSPYGAPTPSSLLPTPSTPGAMNAPPAMLGPTFTSPFASSAPSFNSAGPAGGASSSEPSAGERGPEGANLFIYNIPDHYEDSDLQSMFANCGTIASVRVFKDKFTGVSRGFGFVSYTSASDAQRAIAQLNGFHVGNKRLKVALKTQKNKPGFPY